MQTIALSRQTFVQTLPNPKVACLIVNPQGAVVGQGVHGQAGADHAEVIALREASARAEGATAYVTLEPCGHVGKTGPCVDALLNAGIKRVVFAVSDERHGGSSLLLEKGIDVVAGLREADALRDLAPWLHTEICGSPFITLKVASTLDGFIAAVDGTSQWITSEESRHFVQQIRLEVDGIVTSTETMRKDNPRLNVRDFEVRVQPHVYILGKSEVENTQQLQGGFTAIRSHEPLDVLRQASKDGRKHLLIEAGGKVAGAFLRANLVNRVVWVSAPVLLGDGKKAVQGLEIQTLGDALQGQVIDQFSLGNDFVTILRMNRCSH